MCYVRLVANGRENVVLNRWYMDKNTCAFIALVQTLAESGPYASNGCVTTSLGIES